MNDEIAMNAALDLDPSDVDTRSVLADFYEESGRSDDAERERWLVLVGKYPSRDDDPATPWDWFVWPTRHSEHSRLPLSWYKFLNTDASYPTRSEAEADLWRARIQLTVDNG